jgi:hypothetical protein
MFDYIPPALMQFDLFSVVPRPVFVLALPYSGRSSMHWPQVQAVLTPRSYPISSARFVDVYNA